MNKLVIGTCLVSGLCAIACEDTARVPDKPICGQRRHGDPRKSPAPRRRQGHPRGFGTLPAQFDAKDNPITEDRCSGACLFRQAPVEEPRHLLQQLPRPHDLGVDNQPTSKGHKGQPGSRNWPTVYNAGALSMQFWDGRAETLEEQAKGPVLNPVEMAMPDDKRVVKTLKSMPAYVEAFKKAFPDEQDPVTFDNMARRSAPSCASSSRPRHSTSTSRATTRRSATSRCAASPGSSVGCTACHSGSALGGTSPEARLGEALARRVRSRSLPGHRRTPTR